MLESAQGASWRDRTKLSQKTASRAEVVVIVGYVVRQIDPRLNAGRSTREHHHGSLVRPCGCRWDSLSSPVKLLPGDYRDWAELEAERPRHDRVPCLVPRNPS
jgi:hypothetical protein